MIDIIGFQQDLLDGMTINDACLKHEISFKEAVMLAHGQPSRKTKKVRHKKNHRGVTVSPAQYIYIRNNTYAVRKSVNGKMKMFGTYNSMEDAIRMRDALKADGWHQTHVDRICEKLGIERRNGHFNCKVRYH